MLQSNDYKQIRVKHNEDMKLPDIFDQKHFSLLTGCSESKISDMMECIEKRYYHEFNILKKSGDIRVLNAPSKRLKIVQYWILNNILKNIHISECAMGFCDNKSIVTNAMLHVGKKCIINVDIKDYFPSITQKKVFHIFYYYGYTVEVSHMLSRLCTCNGKLPQGAPTSPYISNIVCLKLDKRLSRLADRFHAVYSRYADDITFSGDTDISTMLPIVKKIIEDEGFRLNDKKTRIAFAHQKQEVTGLLVNGTKVRVDKKYIKHMKREIYYCQKYGAENHLKHIRCNKRFYKEHMYGKAYFIKMVDKECGKRILEELNKVNWY